MAGWLSPEPPGRSLSPRRRDKPSRAAVVAVLAEVDALPGPERQAATGDGQGERRSEQRRLHVGRHVVVTLEGVGPVGRALGNGAVEPAREVPPYVWARVLVERQRSRRVLDQHVQQADAQLVKLGQRAHDLPGDEVEAARARVERDLALEPHGDRERYSGSRATRMSTRSPLNGTPSASSSARCRSPFASEPSARTIRCHGTDGSSIADSTAPATRGAPGETSP